MLSLSHKKIFTSMDVTFVEQESLFFLVLIVGNPGSLYSLSQAQVMRMKIP